MDRIWRKALRASNLEKIIFHKWVEEASVKMHPDNPSYDRPYIITYALIENSKGEIEYLNPQEIIFNRDNN